MAPTNAATRLGQGTEKVREHLMTSLHLARLPPGDRVASARRLADITGLNRKTVHRAYGALVREGFLDVRPGLAAHWRLAQGTLERLRAESAFDLAAKRAGHA